MTNEPRADDLDARLLAVLRREIADEGFSARVTSTLPAPASRRDWTWPLLAAGALAGCMAATFAFPVGPALLEGWRDLAMARAVTPAALGALAASLGLAVSAAVIAFDA